MRRVIAFPERRPSLELEGEFGVRVDDGGLLAGLRVACTSAGSCPEVALSVMVDLGNSKAALKVLTSVRLCLGEGAMMFSTWLYFSVKLRGLWKRRRIRKAWMRGGGLI
jgi:hypothetical protein